MLGLNPICFSFRFPSYKYWAFTCIFDSLIIIHLLVPLLLKHFCSKFTSSTTLIKRNITHLVTSHLLSGDYLFPHEAPNPLINIPKPLLHFQNLSKNPPLLYASFSVPSYQCLQISIWKSGLMSGRGGVLLWPSRLPQYIECSPCG